MAVTRRTFLGLLAAASAYPHAGTATPSALYFGSYTSAGLGLATYDVSGTITATGVVAGVEDPSFVIRAGRFLYAVNEQPEGGVTAISLDDRPRVLNRQPTGGSAPCHLALVAGGRFLLSANYGSGDVAVHPVEPDGSLGARSDLAGHGGTAPHAHQVVEDPSGDYLLSVDLGTDTIHTHTLSPSGRLTEVARTTLATGAGPRHLAFHPDGRHLYVANELDSTVVACAYADGRLTPGTPIPAAPAGGVRNYPGEILVAPGGDFVYVTNRGHNSVAVFAVADDGAALRPVATPGCGGDWPRHAVLDPSGRLLFVANQRSGSIATFHRDPGTGALHAVSSFVTPSPACVTL